MTQVGEGRANMQQEVRRLNWGCGEWPEPGWLNSDIKETPGVIACDIREGLAFDAESFEYIVSIHALPELPYEDLVPALRELRRVLKPGGILRLGLPDLDRGLEAYKRGERSYFLVPDEDMSTIGGKFAVQATWYGYVRSVFVREFVQELLQKAGFHEIHHVGFRETRSRYPGIVSLDNRERESLFVEAVK